MSLAVGAPLFSPAVGSPSSLHRSASIPCRICQVPAPGAVQACHLRGHNLKRPWSNGWRLGCFPSQLSSPWALNPLHRGFQETQAPLPTLEGPHLTQKHSPHSWMNSQACLGHLCTRALLESLCPMVGLPPTWKCRLSPLLCFSCHQSPPSRQGWSHVP